MTTRIGKYEILGQLGAGGMGVVYRARDTTLDRFVALKVLRQKLRAGDNARKRFLNEARVAAALTHPNIVGIYELGFQEDQPFIAMEYLSGRDLGELIERRHPLSLRQRAGIALQVARALEHAHSHGVIHRDVKPANIRILKNGLVKLMDFGIAKATGELLPGLTTTGAVIGSALYMSPEQARGETLTPASDIFSFGAVVYEILTGRRPFAADSIAAVIFRILAEEPPPLTPEQATPELKQLVKRCMHKSVGQRFQSFTPIIRILQSIRRQIPRSSGNKDLLPLGRAVGERRRDGSITDTSGRVLLGSLSETIELQDENPVDLGREPSGEMLALAEDGGDASPTGQSTMSRESLQSTDMTTSLRVPVASTPASTNSSPALSSGGRPSDGNSGASEQTDRPDLASDFELNIPGKGLLKRVRPASSATDSALLLRKFRPLDAHDPARSQPNRRFGFLGVLLAVVSVGIFAGVGASWFLGSGGVSKLLARFGVADKRVEPTPVPRPPVVLPPSSQRSPVAVATAVPTIRVARPTPTKLAPTSLPGSSRGPTKRGSGALQQAFPTPAGRQATPLRAPLVASPTGSTQAAHTATPLLLTPTPAGRTMGQLIVQTEPWAYFTLDDEPTQYETPAGMDLVAQTYRIKIFRDGYQSIERHVIVETNQINTQRYKLLKLERGAVTIMPQGPSWVYFRIDGGKVKTTPHAPLELSAGMHTVVVSQKGYKKVIQRFEVQPGKQQEVWIPMEKEP